MTALRFLPPLCWTALIAWLSTSDWSAARTGARLLPLLHALLPWALPEQLAALHWLGRKLGHVIEYAVVAVLWRRALVSEAHPGAWRLPFALALLTASLDELHQATTPTREGSVADVLLDTGAAALALVTLAGGTRRLAGRLTGLLLWLAGAGGTALIAVNFAAAAPSRWLWFSVPAAWLALWLWRRGRTRA